MRSVATPKHRRSRSGLLPVFTVGAVVSLVLTVVGGLSAATATSAGTGHGDHPWWHVTVSPTKTVTATQTVTVTANATATVPGPTATVTVAGPSQTATPTAAAPTASSTAPIAVPTAATVNAATDFAAPHKSGFWFPNGVTGAGVDSTVYEIKPWTSSVASIVNSLVARQTNPYRVMKVGSASSSTPVQNLNVSDFTLQGTPQGHNYGGLDVLYADNPHVHDLKILGPTPGNAPGPPGETFLLHTQRTNHPVFSDLLLDGHDTDGTRAAGTINGNSYLPNGGSWTRVKFTGAAGGFGTAIFQASHGDFRWTDCEWTDNRQHINIEDSKGDATYTFVRPKFGSIAGNSRYVAQISSKTSSAKVTFIDPIVKSWPLTVRWYPNSGGTQLKSDIRLIINGVDVSNDPTKLAFVNF